MFRNLQGSFQSSFPTGALECSVKDDKPLRKNCFPTGFCVHLLPFACVVTALVSSSQYISQSCLGNPRYHLSGELESQLFKNQCLHIPLDSLLSFCLASNASEKRSFVIFLDLPLWFPKPQRLRADRDSAADFKATFSFTKRGTMTWL